MGIINTVVEFGLSAHHYLNKTAFETKQEDLGHAVTHFFDVLEKPRDIYAHKGKTLFQIFGNAVRSDHYISNISNMTPKQEWKNFIDVMNRSAWTLEAQCEDKSSKRVLSAFIKIRKEWDSASNYQKNNMDRIPFLYQGMIKPSEILMALKQTNSPEDFKSKLRQTYTSKNIRLGQR